MKNYLITIYYNGAKFTYYYQSDVKDFAKQLDNGQLLNEGFTTLKVLNEGKQECYIHLSPQNCGHIEIKEITK